MTQMRRLRVHKLATCKYSLHIRSKTRIYNEKGSFTRPCTYAYVLVEVRLPDYYTRHPLVVSVTFLHTTVEAYLISNKQGSR